MTLINIIDFDKTLIPFDSFKRYLLNRIIRFDLIVIYFTIMRKFRLLSAFRFNSKIVQHMEEISDDYDTYVNYLLTNIDKSVLDIINRYTFKNTLNIILSASPDVYISKVAEKIGWKGYGSYFDSDGNFHHLYGQGKIKFLNDKYPKNKYKYHFAISDSRSDLNLLKIFSYYKFVN